MEFCYINHVISPPTCNIKVRREERRKERGRGGGSKTRGLSWLIVKRHEKQLVVKKVQSSGFRRSTESSSNWSHLFSKGVATSRRVTTCIREATTAATATAIWPMMLPLNNFHFLIWKKILYHLFDSRFSKNLLHRPFSRYRGKKFEKWAESMTEITLRAENKRLNIIFFFFFGEKKFFTKLWDFCSSH